MLGRLWAKYLHALSETPLKANFLTGGLLGFTGDVICQLGVERQKHMDWQRCFALTTFGFGYMGVVCYKVYGFYRIILPARVLKTPLYEGVASSAIDNFVHVPFLYLPAFYAITETLQGRTVHEAYETFKSCGIPSILACWGMWIPFQTLNFGFIPPANRTAAVNVFCLLWNVVLDWIAHNTEEHHDAE